MKKKYIVSYVWHSGDCFGVNDWCEKIYEIEEEELEEWKKDFQDDDMDGSYRSINSIREVKDNEQ